MERSYRNGLGTLRSTARRGILSSPARIGAGDANKEKLKRRIQGRLASEVQADVASRIYEMTQQKSNSKDFSASQQKLVNILKKTTTKIKKFALWHVATQSKSREHQDAHLGQERFLERLELLPEGLFNDARDLLGVFCWSRNKLQRDHSSCLSVLFGLLHLNATLIESQRDL